jgi:hypothetical protein
MNASIWDVTNAEYHADNTKVGSTMLNDFLYSPATYYGKYVGKDKDGNPLIPHEQTRDMLLGSVTHCLILEPDQFSKLYACRPEGIDGRTTRGKDELAKWRASAIGKEEIDAGILEQATAMAKAVLTNPMVSDLTMFAIRERAIICQDPTSGIWQKCKADWFIAKIDQDTDLHLDLKTSDDPTPEAWEKPWGPMAKFGYSLQVASHYPAVIEDLTGRLCASGVVVVGKAAPHDVYVYDTTAWRLDGETKRRSALDGLAECIASGNWTRYEQCEPYKLSPPTWRK